MVSEYMYLSDLLSLRCASPFPAVKQAYVIEDSITFRDIEHVVFLTLSNNSVDPHK